MTVEEQLISALAEVERLRKAVVGKDAEISRKDAEIKKLSDTLLWLRRKVFGSMSERICLLIQTSFSSSSRST